MADNIIHIHKQRKYWICVCGCSTFIIFDDGSSVCAHCDKPTNIPTGGWRNFDPEKMIDVDESFAEISANGSIDFARHNIASQASDKDVAFSIVAKESGRVSIWSKAKTEEQIDWVNKKTRRGEKPNRQKYRREETE